MGGTVLITTKAQNLRGHALEIVYWSNTEEANGNLYLAY